MFKLQGEPQPIFAPYISTCPGRLFIHWEDLYKPGRLRGEVGMDKETPDMHPIAL